MSKNFYEVVVIGAGHAGVEAACAAARCGAKVLLATKKPDNLGEMSCNPAIGGVAKGTIVREIDALDGIMGRAIDMAGIHFRILNLSKGAAVHSPRAQADRKLYKKAVNEILKDYKNIDTIFASVEDIAIEDGEAKAVILDSGSYIEAKSVILTTGTFLSGVIHIGNTQTPAGRFDEKPSHGLSKTLKKHNFNIARLKTGTPPRILKSSIDFSNLEEQAGDNPPQPFSYLNKEIKTEQIKCYITYTNSKTHQIIKNNLEKSAMYGGAISGNGPRYCPSIEDKINRFFDKDRHQIFLEPEGLDSDLIYPNGISTSLPIEVQEEFIKTIKGLENCKIVQTGYAIEYDFVDPRELLPTLETKKIKNLFFAGQINGTTGYEEAAGQGLVAGVNAALRVNKKNREFIISRSDGYIGVMIDDLTSLGTSEPYRMLTSRSEYRLSLRCDNADQRLTQKAIDYGFCSKEREFLYKQKINNIKKAQDILCNLKISPSKIERDHKLQIKQNGIIRNATQLLSLQNFDFIDLQKIWPQEISQIDDGIRRQLKIDATYQSYVKRQEKDLELLRGNENIKIPLDIDYDAIQSLSLEVREKLGEYRPPSIASALKIGGITPASVMAILIYLKKSSIIK